MVILGTSNIEKNLMVFCTLFFFCILHVAKHISILRTIKRVSKQRNTISYLYIDEPTILTHYTRFDRINMPLRCKHILRLPISFSRQYTTFLVIFATSILYCTCTEPKQAHINLLVNGCKTTHAFICCSDVALPLCMCNTQTARQLENTYRNLSWTLPDGNGVCKGKQKYIVREKPLKYLTRYHSHEVIDFILVCAYSQYREKSGTDTPRAHHHNFQLL